jgi:hypothetical protein
MRRHIFVAGDLGQRQNCRSGMRLRKLDQLTAYAGRSAAGVAAHPTGELAETTEDVGADQEFVAWICDESNTNESLSEQRKGYLSYPITQQLVI